jgi:hypothetical protein
MPAEVRVKHCQNVTEQMWLNTITEVSLRFIQTRKQTFCA